MLPMPQILLVIAISVMLDTNAATLTLLSFVCRAQLILWGTDEAVTHAQQGHNPTMRRQLVWTALQEGGRLLESVNHAHMAR